MNTKICRRCGKDKSTNEFYTCKTTRDKLQSWCKSCVAERAKQWQKENPGWHNRTSKNWNKENPDKIKAQQYVNLAVYFSDMIKPTLCSCCGSEKKLDAHHSDYTKPLEVTWLCRKCHLKEHRRLKDA